MEDIRRKCNPIVDLLKFTFNKKILSKVITWAITNFVTKLFILIITYYIKEKFYKKFLFLHAR